MHFHPSNLPQEHTLPAGYYPDPERIVNLNQMADGITELVAHLDAGTFQLLKLIWEFDEAEGWSGPGINSCAHWLNWKCGMSMGSARERVRVARALPKLPEISAAFRAGRVSYSKVRAMTVLCCKRLWRPPVINCLKSSEVFLKVFPRKFQTTNH